MSINHPNYIDVKRDLYNANAGYGGEEYIDSVLSTIHFSIPHLTSHSICQQYKILPSDLLKGIFCTKCDGPLIKESNRIYVCTHCLHIPDNPFYNVMVDWFTLISNQISNRQLRFLSGIEASYIVGYFMKNSQFPHSGMNKGLVYHVNQHEQQNFILQSKNRHHIKQ